jgi:hypothetical protein
MTGLTACETSQGNPKLQVSIADCGAGLNPASAPQPSAKDDAGELAARYAIWGAENVKRMHKREACEQRVRERFAKGG